jgi:hypothetical protein
MSLRIRQVKPAFWSDAKLLKLPADVRLFYVGTWCVCDDAGWFVWDAEQVATDLHMRASVVVRAMHVMTETGRIVIHECGHAEVVHFIEHQRLAGPTKRIETVYRTHLSRCPRESGGKPRETAGNRESGVVSKGKERSVEVREPATGLRELVKVDPETGGYVYVAPEAKA